MSNNITGDGIGSTHHGLRSFVEDAKDGLAEMSAIERGLHLLWLLGPFILLIERSAADVWLTLLALAFVVRAVIHGEGWFLRVFWVRAAFVFWSVCLLSATLSTDPAYALGEAAGWIRFPLFAMANAFWLGRDKRLLYAMLIVTAIGLLMMCCILTAEIIIEGHKGGRLSWPYGDSVPGNYIAKVGLPAFTIMVALAVSIRGRLAAISGILALITMILSLMTGERINFLIRAFGGMLAGLVWRPIWRRYIVLVAVEFLAVMVVFTAMPQLGHRYVDNFLEQLPTGQHSGYYQVMVPGFLAFEQAPVLGTGTGNFRNLCSEIIAETKGLRCGNHPHNFYVQLAAETGLIGLVAGTIFLWSIVWTCFRAGWKRQDNVVLATAWVIPFGLFWPIASNHNFFGQWNNIFMWNAVALALASVNLSKSLQHDQKDT